jgi:hypothetical protein
MDELQLSVMDELQLSVMDELKLSFHSSMTPAGNNLGE